MSDLDLSLPRDLEKLVDPSLLAKPTDLTVACYTFPHFHHSAVNDRIYGRGWTEYILMRGCQPWFQGHNQPRQPLLGELDERDPATWERYCDLASSHGIDVFIWDCYWFGGEPALHEALEEGFFGARNSDRMRFAAMWTNHIWPIQFPMVQLDGSARHQIAFPFPDSPAEIWRSLTYLLARYLHRPNYWKIDGKPVLVIWSADNMVDVLGREGTREMLKELRLHARRLGHEGLFIHVTQGSQRLFPDLLDLGFDSYDLYNAIFIAGAMRPDDEELCDYGVAAADVVRTIWPQVDSVSPLPCFPSVSPGWDTSPRYVAPPRGSGSSREHWPGIRPIVVNETPAAFEALVRAAFGYLNARPNTPRVISIGCWNEWTEGQYLLPDTRLGYGMLNALGTALGKVPEALPGVSGLDEPATERFPVQQEAT